MRIFFLCLVASFAVFPSSSVNAIDIDALIDELVQGLPDENGNTPPPPPPASLAPEDFEKFEKEAAEYMHREELKLNETAGDWKGAEVKAMGELGDAFAKEAVDQHVEIKKDPTRADQIKEEKKKIRDSHPGPYVTFPEDEHEGSGAGEATTVVGETTSDESTTTESEGTTESGETTASGETTESGETTASGETTESGETTVSGETTESGGTTATEESTMSSETQPPETSEAAGGSGEETTVTTSEETSTGESSTAANEEGGGEEGQTSSAPETPTTSDGQTEPPATTPDETEPTTPDTPTTTGGEPTGDEELPGAGHGGGGLALKEQLAAHNHKTEKPKPGNQFNVNLQRMKRSAVVRKPTHKTKTQWKKRPRKIRDHDVVPKKISDKHKKTPHPTIRQKKKKVVAKQGRGLGKLIATASGDRRIHP